MSIPFQTVPVVNHHFFKIRITSLQGGHSGTDIILQRVNFIKTMGIILNKLFYETDMYSVHLSGESKTNAIPRETDAVVYIKSPGEKELQNIIESLNTELK